MDLIDFFENEYNEENWKDYVKGFEKSSMRIEGISQDVVNVVLNLLGDDVGYEWLHTPFDKFDGKNALDLMNTSKGERALKAFIMRLPT